MHNNKYQKNSYTFIMSVFITTVFIAAMFFYATAHAEQNISEIDKLTIINSEPEMNEHSHSADTLAPLVVAPDKVPKKSVQTNVETSLKNSSALSEMEEQQRILQQYKPLIKPRSYDDLITYDTTNATPLILNRLPELDELMIPGRAPNIRLIPYLRKSFAHPAYAARLNNIDYLIAVNCNDPSGFDDCSTSPQNQFKTKRVYVRFIQSSDAKLQPVIGLKVGRLYSQVKSLFSDDAESFGDGECLQTESEWIACFDSSEMSVNKQTLKMIPANHAKLRRFLKIKGRAY